MDVPNLPRLGFPLQNLSSRIRWNPFLLQGLQTKGPVRYLKLIQGYWQLESSIPVPYMYKAWLHSSHHKIRGEAGHLALGCLIIEAEMGGPLPKNRKA